MKWTEEQDAFLRAMYFESPMSRIIDATGRSLNAIYIRSKTLGLKRKYNGGFQVGNTFRNRKSAAPRPPTLQDRVLTFLRDTDSALIARDVAKAMGITGTASVSLALRRLHRGKEIHVSEYRPKVRKHDPRWIPAYSFGKGADTKMPEPDAAERFHAPNPIPYNTLPFFHEHVFKPAMQAEGITE